MHNLKEIYNNLLEIANSGKSNPDVFDAREIVELIERNFLAIRDLHGNFHEVYPPLAEVFSSLPSMEMVSEAIINKNYEQLKEWYAEETDNELHAGEYNHYPCSMEIVDDGSLIFYTGTSSRLIEVKTDLTATCDFGASVRAASEVISLIKKAHPTTSAHCNFERHGYYPVAEFKLEDGIFALHAPQWMRQ